MAHKLTYGAYLRTDDLLQLQTPLSDPVHHDELLFIVAHQVYELWFKQIIHELEAAMHFIETDELLKVAKNFRRIHTIQRLLEQQIDVLETMTPQEFNAFRDNLNPASGFQSSQFREIEFLAGLKRTEHLKFLEIPAEAQATLERRLAEPSLYDVVKTLLRGRGLATGTHDELLATFKTIYERFAEHYDLYMLLEDLIEFDERFLLWRGRHIRMVERMIGFKRGTGGSPGVKYLATTLDRKFFPELWEVRTQLQGGDYSS